MGVEYNPSADDVSALANLVALGEGRRRPAVVIGTSSDRIGTPDGQSYYATLSKDLSSVNGWPVAPYVGVAYGTHANDTRVIGGVRLRVPGTGWASTWLYDGEALHPTVEYRFLDRHSVSALWVDTETYGLAYNVAF